jgi:XTP/dITP diphosphohydrolase
MIRILLASRNGGKLKEFETLLPEVQWLTLPPTVSPLPETGTFFEENARQKLEAARAWYEQQSALCVDGILSDDSGLCVDALWGAPGVLTAHFGPGLSPHERNIKLLTLLQANDPRSARYVCILAWWEPHGAIKTFLGVAEGSLSETPRGHRGFGYDPIFQPHPLDKTFGEMEDSDKNLISHRGLATQALKKYLETSKK